MGSFLQKLPLFLGYISELMSSKELKSVIATEPMSQFNWNFIQIYLRGIRVDQGKTVLVRHTQLVYLEKVKSHSSIQSLVPV